MPQMDKSTEELVRVTRWLRQHNPVKYAAIRERLRDLLGIYFAYVEESPHTVAPS
jgi:2-methylcitrate dehydratase PrpD